MAQIVVIALVSLNFTPISSGQDDGFQSVSGDFARNWLDDFLIENPKLAEEKEIGLWGWGGTPKGKMAINGMLMPIPDINITNVADLGNRTGNWLGEVYKDPYSGSPVYYNRPPFFGSNSYSGDNSGINSDYYPRLPPVFGTNNPWA